MRRSRCLIIALVACALMLAPAARADDSSDGFQQFLVDPLFGLVGTFWGIFTS
jgi:hypothetical protein